MIKSNTYEENHFNVYDKILIDTSTLMHYRALRKFIAKAGDSLLIENKMIFVPKVVWLELVRAYNSRDPEKVKCSENAISLISSHRDIFDIEDEQFFQDEMESCFADKVLLSSLILDKTDSKILFITNDRMLSRDANEINHQASCRGYKIDTCFITDSGTLKPGHKAKKDEPIVKEENIIKDKPAVEKVEVIKYINVPEEVKKPSIWITVGKYTAVAVSGILVGAFGKDFIEYVKTQGGNKYGKRNNQQCC